MAESEGLGAISEEPDAETCSHCGAGDYVPGEGCLVCGAGPPDREQVSGATVSPLIYRLMEEIDRQDAKHGPYEGTMLGRSRLALATLEDEVREALNAWRDERDALNWDETRAEVLQVAAVAIRALRDAL